MILIFFCFLFLLGLVFGSFIAAWVSRAHHEMSIWFGRSHCLSCQYTLQLQDLVPVLSFLILQGKCRKCETPISKHYFFTELLTALIFVFLGYFYQASFLFVPSQFIFALLASIFLIAIFVSDFLYQEIPFGMTIFPALMLGLLAFGLGLMDWKNMLQGAIIAAGFFLLQYVISRGRWIGFGDVLLGVFIGFVLGGQKTLLALALAYMSAACISLILLASKKIDRKTAVPFGTFLSISTFAAMLYGEKIITWFLHLLYL